MIQAIRGTKDLLPDTIALWQYAEEVFRNISHSYLYREMRTPIFEKTEVFSRSIGEQTDIVNKEMYTFEDRSGESITLRPEMTAAIARAVMQNSLMQQSSVLRYWYFGPFFRYERPQKGRLRQFHQYGAECILSPYPESDVEVMLLANDIIKSMGIEKYTLLLNSIGNEASRDKYREALKDYFFQFTDQISEDSQKRLEHNPLRILDSKDPRDQEYIKKAPDITDFLDPESKDHFESVKEQLREANVEFELNPRLVRGLDYYSHTVFEFQSDALGAQDSFGGGGRYNTLFTQLGGKDEVPAVGLAMGVERLLMILDAQENMPDMVTRPDVYIVTTDTALTPKAQEIGRKLRKAGKNVMIDLQRRSMKAQFRESNKMNSNYTIIVGEDEIKRGAVQLKNMESGDQKEVKLSDLENYKFDE